MTTIERIVGNPKLVLDVNFLDVLNDLREIHRKEGEIQALDSIYHLQNISEPIFEEFITAHKHRIEELIDKANSDPSEEVNIDWLASHFEIIKLIREVKTSGVQKEMLDNLYSLAVTKLLKEFSTYSPIADSVDLQRKSFALLFTVFPEGIHKYELDFEINFFNDCDLLAEKKLEDIDFSRFSKHFSIFSATTKSAYIESEPLARYLANRLQEEYFVHHPETKSKLRREAVLRELNSQGINPAIFAQLKEHSVRGKYRDDDPEVG